MMNFLKKIEMNRERRYLLIGGAVLLLLGAVYRFGPDVFGFFSISDDIAFKKTHVEKYLKVAAQKKELDKAQKNLNQVLNRMEFGLLTGKTPSLAAVEVQNLLNEIAGSNGINIDTMQVLKPEEDKAAGYITIPVRFMMHSNIVQLKGMLYGIESSPKHLVVAEISADVSPRRSSSAQIRSSITVKGVMKLPQTRG